MVRFAGMPAIYQAFEQNTWSIDSQDLSLELGRAGFDFEEEKRGLATGSAKNSS